MTLTFANKPISQPIPADERARRLTNLGFGRVFSEHMVTAHWTAGQGWHDGELAPYGPVPMDPANMALHYGQTIFEGLKAYRQPGSSIAVFRPDQNAQRFQRSARRLALPELPEEDFLTAVQLLVDADRDWVPGGRDESLYLRPFMYANEVGLGVKPASEVTFQVIASPAGSYFRNGVQPVNVWLCEDYVRAAPGGTGEAKCGGNYAASLLAQAQATSMGCDQVVWLDALEHRYVEEMGGMNIYFVLGSGENATVVTPALTGSLLAGITRDSILTLAGDMGLGAQERLVDTEEWRAGNASGAISEVFACGTAALITPVGFVKHAAGEWTVGDGSAGPVTTALRERLVGIQYGTTEDTHGWMHRIDGSSVRTMR